MSRPDILPEEPKRQLALFGVPLPRILMALLMVAALGVYIGMLLFGPNSLTVLLGLEEQHAAYARHIKELKARNAALQKEYFELKQLEPEP